MDTQDLMLSYAAVKTLRYSLVLVLLLLLLYNKMKSALFSVHNQNPLFLSEFFDMAALLSSRSCKAFVVLSIIVSVFCFYSVAGQGSAQIFTNGLSCFNNKFIYNKCNEAYRLNQGGDLNVPPEATDEFCNGACLGETQGLLNCIDKIASGSGFLFFNKATTRVIRRTLGSACSYTSQRGNFNVGDYVQSDTSDSLGLPKPARLHALVSVMAGFFLLLN